MMSPRQLIGLGRALVRQPPAVGRSPADAVHRENKWTLLRYRARPSGLAYRTPVLLVPSLINRHYVLDLIPGKSFVEYLVAQGHDVFVIDWGTPAAEDRELGFDAIVDGYIGRAIRRATRAAGADRAHVLGYCLGGTMATIYTAVHPEQVASLTTLAAPVAFAHAGRLATWTRTRTFDVDALVAGTGLVPWPLMQIAFHLLRPTSGVGKLVDLIDRAWDDAFLDSFWAVERWGNDNVSFPGACFATYIKALYRDDALINDRLSLSGRPVRLGAIECPLIAVTFAHDHIVPWQSAAPLVDRVGSTDKTHLHLQGGHVGAVVSRRAATELWPQLTRFWAERDDHRLTTRRRRLDCQTPRPSADSIVRAQACRS